MADRLDYSWDALGRYGVDFDEYDDTAPELREDPQEICPVCGGPPTDLGRLGNFHYVQCRDCGFDWSIPIERSLR